MSELKRLIGFKLHSMSPHDFNDGWAFCFQDNLNSGDDYKNTANLTVNNNVQFMDIDTYSGGIKGFIVKE